MWVLERSCLCWSPKAPGAAEAVTGSAHLVPGGVAVLLRHPLGREGADVAPGSKGDSMALEDPHDVLGHDGDEVPQCHQGSHEDLWDGVLRARSDSQGWARWACCFNQPGTGCARGGGAAWRRTESAAPLTRRTS